MKYTEEHLWLREEDDGVVIGLTEHVIEELGELSFVELPEVGTTVTKDEEIIVIEASDASSDILSPIDGEIVEVNEALVDNPSLANEDAIGAGWFLKIEASDETQLDEFMEEATYSKYIA
ncbi:glycine cleavage system protein GcvH [Planktotalea sp.]|uniref:glycine cleavage system protein GcvH n=1 Tax=Planktotalea sp. TaxID=2029877 RepID=UPI0032971525